MVAGVTAWQLPRLIEATPRVAPATSPGASVAGIVSNGTGLASPITRPDRSRNETLGCPAKEQADDDRFLNPSGVYIVPPAPCPPWSVTLRSDGRQARDAALVTVVPLVVEVVIGAFAAVQHPTGRPRTAPHDSNPSPTDVERLVGGLSCALSDDPPNVQPLNNITTKPAAHPAMAFMIIIVAHEGLVRKCWFPIARSAASRAGDHAP
jgi:hypothetical protein